MMFITLPSGRKLSYIKPELSLTNSEETESPTRYQVLQRNERIETYGPKLTKIQFRQ